ncbi:hypothetical protein GCM10025868_02730 [Angustibacter aerolatus]|uniref:Uncharacterized protein n=1 Tax=Angustibacter aerolatus TaxID=1162965 RepID=A0ABQ6JC32_9ACTN|nr:hypothetical protein GCM10025868_02730 [Angustibacter aerolatus]
MPDDVLDVTVPDGRGKRVRVRAVPWLRLKEVALHHVDLRLAHRLADAPQRLLRRAIEECADRFADLSPASTCRRCCRTGSSSRCGSATGGCGHRVTPPTCSAG